MIKLSEKAKQELVEVLEDKAQKDHPLRVHVSAIGWGGPRFGLALDEKQEEDNIYEVEGFNFIVEKSIEEQYGPFEIDYSGGWIGKGFVITSKKVYGSC